MKLRARTVVAGTTPAAAGLAVAVAFATVLPAQAATALKGLAEQHSRYFGTATGAVTVRNASYNATVAAGGSTTFGFTATGDGTVAATAVSCSSP